LPKAVPESYHLIRKGPGFIKLNVMRMNTAGRWIIRREELNLYRSEISRENRYSFRLLSVWGLIISV